MAGDWIKLEAVTLEKPEIYALAEHLHCTHEAAFVACCRLWIWADQQSRDGHDISVTKTTIDSVSRVTGFADAMKKAGWLTAENGSISLPNFDRHNGKTAKERALANRRKVTQRSRETSRSERDKNATREEKRREVNPKVPSAGFDRFWDAYPKKVAKGYATKTWNALNPDSPLQMQILKALALRDWPADEQYIPHPASWLNSQGWLDEGMAKKAPGLVL